MSLFIADCPIKYPHVWVSAAKHCTPQASLHLTKQVPAALGQPPGFGASLISDYAYTDVF